MLMIFYFFQYFAYKMSLGGVRLVINVVLLTVCSYLYWKCIQTLKTSSHITRKKLLTIAFATNLACWAFTVVPHVIFEDFVTRERSPNFAEFFITVYDRNGFNGRELYNSGLNSEHAAVVQGGA